MNYKFNLLHHVGVVAKRLHAAAAASAAHEGDDNTPSGPTGRGVKNTVPGTEPCGTPRVNRIESDTVFPIRILCALFVR